MGHVIRAWGRCRPLCSPLQAEVAALQWAVELASCEHWQQLIFEGEAKACFDVLSSSTPPLDWSISTIISNIHCLSVGLPSVKFCWVMRQCNSAAHVVARFALNSGQSFFSIMVIFIDFVCKVDYRHLFFLSCLMILQII